MGFTGGILGSSIIYMCYDLACYHDAINFAS